MNTLDQTPVLSTITESLKKSYTYPEYRTLVSDLVATNGATGPDQSEAMANYTMLNDKRMKRWDKTIKITEDAKQKIADFKGDFTWVVLTESWCGDAAHVVPAIQKVAELNENIDLKIVLRDENEALMDQFLTNGGKSIPKLIMLNNTTGEVVGSYGPRPTEATAMVNDYKAKHGALTPEFKEELQRWYNKNKGQAVVNDMLAELSL